jgi:hypothetical protein
MSIDRVERKCNKVDLKIKSQSALARGIRTYLETPGMTQKDVFEVNKDSGVSRSRLIDEGKWPADWDDNSTESLINDGQIEPSPQCRRIK